LFKHGRPAALQRAGAAYPTKATIRMETTAVQGIAGSEASKAASAASKSMGKEAFLTLLISQLQHQDPLNPADSTEFTAQLAQFSSLEQLSNINANLDALKLYQASINNAQAVSFIGKEVVSKGNHLELKADQPAICEFDLSSAAKRAAVSIYDATGAFVADIQLTGLNAGRQTVSWNGKDRNGNPAPAGDYTFKVQAEGAAGEKLAPIPYSRGTVTGVTFENNLTYLVVGKSRIAMGDVILISQAPVTKAS
jgi:flagellar basal-body rod modification protein FlgD